MSTLNHEPPVLRAAPAVRFVDDLTGLGNRRKLLLDLKDTLSAVTRRPSHPAAFLVFDLHGLQGYARSYGQQAGNELLRHLAGRLARALGENSTAYRLGGDELCVILPFNPQTHETTEKLRAALTLQEGEHRIFAAHGSAVMPHEAATIPDVMALSNERLAAVNTQWRTRACAQVRDLLVSALTERSEDLGEHNDDVAVLAAQVAEAMGLPEEQIDDVVRAAELHDVGKVAIPDSILFKPGPLDMEEWATMRTHTLIGERILSRSAELDRTAQMVRSSHERWDGLGYPDGLAGGDIPLGARIVAVCDAYDAMISDRCYRTGMSQQEALSELERCSGTQFDPEIVSVFSALLTGAPLLHAA